MLREREGQGHLGSTLAIVFGFILAALIDREKRGEGFFRTVFLYPLAVSLIVTGVAWRWMFNPTLGIQNFLHSVGLTFGGLGTQPMSVVLANVVIITTGEASYNENMAAALLTAIPPLFIYFVLGKFFVQGITAGAIKG